MFFIIMNILSLYLYVTHEEIQKIIALIKVGQKQILVSNIHDVPEWTLDLIKKQNFPSCIKMKYIIWVLSQQDLALLIKFLMTSQPNVRIDWWRAGFNFPVQQFDLSYWQALWLLYFHERKSQGGEISRSGRLISFSPSRDQAVRNFTGRKGIVLPIEWYLAPPCCSAMSKSFQCCLNNSGSMLLYLSPLIVTLCLPDFIKKRSYDPVAPCCNSVTI